MRKLLLQALLVMWAQASVAATLYIAEFNWKQGQLVEGYPAAVMPAAALQTPISIGASSVQSTAFGSSTGLIRVISDTACHVVIGGTSPSATANSMYIAAGVPEYFIVQPGDKLAVIN